jgi:predicted DNA-binding antitoxin AbrB/MazE fold protein
MGKRRTSVKAIEHAVTRGQGVSPKPLPETIELKESQRVAINALANDEVRFSQLIQQTREARAKILAEIEREHRLEAGVVGAAYQYDGSKLVKATS